MRKNKKNNKNSSFQLPAAALAVACSLSATALAQQSPQIDFQSVGRGAPLALDPDAGPGIHAACLDAADVLRQPEDAVAVGALQVRFGHQLRDRRSVRCRRADALERFCGEGFQRLGVNAVHR